MPECFENPQMQQYFSSLPVYVQETIKLLWFFFA